MIALFPILIFSMVWSLIVWGAAVLFGEGEAHKSWSGYWLAHLALMAVPPLIAVALLLLPDFQRPAFMPDFTVLPAAEAQFDEGGGTAPANSWRLFELWLPVLLTGVYLTGLAWQMVRLGYGTIRLSWLVAKAEPRLPQREGARILVAPIASTPFALGRGVWKNSRARIILPRHLLRKTRNDSLEAIITHEQAHIDRRDPEIGALLRWAQAFFWVSPFFNDLIKRWQLAAELQADAVALNGASKEMRKAYAESLLMALRIPAGEVVRTPSASFSTHHLRSEKMRIKTIMRGSVKVRKGLAITTGLALGGLALGLVGTTGAVALTASASVPKENSPIVKEGRISSDYGTKRRVAKDGTPLTAKEATAKATQPRVHSGVDVAAPRGSAIHAPADGWVVEITENYNGNSGYGKVLVLQTANDTKTVFAHLDGYKAKLGSTVKAGEHIAILGNTGRSTGPHVHIEVYVKGERVDPVTVWPKLIG